MIFTEKKITITNNQCKIDTPVVLYRGDYNVEVRFTIVSSPYKYSNKQETNVIENTEASYGQLVIKTPGDKAPIFSDISETKGGAVTFTITEEMIDEVGEVGNYTFQIRLLDANRESRVTMPEVIDGIEIREPIATEDVTDTNEVGVATVDYALTTAGTPEDTFNSQGNYNKTTWATGDRITSDKLNKIEAGIDGVNKKVASGGTGNVDLSDYQTKTDASLKTISKTIVGAINEHDSQIKDIAKDVLLEDGKLYLKKSDGTKLGTGVILPISGSGGSVAWESITGKPATFTPSSHSHSKSDITDFPTIPTKTSQLTNDSDFINTTQMNEAIANVTGQTIVEPAELDMPKVFIYGNALPTTKDNVNLTMDYVSNTTKFSSYIKLKCQGTSSMSYAKKNFTINMYSDDARSTKLKKDFKGWGEQSKFCLKANYVDTTHTRNLSGARIAHDMVASRPDSEFKQQLLTAPRYGAVDGFPIKLYFNGEFYGIYTWNIPKDAWMFNMDESNPNHCVLCAERNNVGNMNTINSCQFRKVWNGSGDWSVEVGTASANIKASFDRCINFVMTSTDDEFKANISEYFDLYSLLDYYCFSYLVCHLDGLAKNMLMATYDGVHWGTSLYDMDSIYGVYYNGASYVATNYQCPEQYQETNSLLWQRIEANFSAELYARYLELRQGALSLSNIVKHVEEIYDVIPDRVFADEKAKWTSLPQVNTNTMTRFRNYMRDRAVYVDAQMEEIGTKVPCTGIVLSNDTLSFTTTAARTLSVIVSPNNCTDEVTWSVSPSGIVTVNNGVVTPKSNGTCTITATCGSYSDTCNVTVSGMSESGGGNTNNYVTDSLFAYYDLTQLSTYTSTVEDLSGNNNTLNVVSGTLIKDDLGGLIYGDNSPLIRSDSFNVQSAEASVEYTFKYTGINDCRSAETFNNRTCGINGTNGYGYYLWVSGYGYTTYKNGERIDKDSPFSSTLVNGKYYHIICTFSANEVKMYLNGELLNTSNLTITGIPSNTTYFLGATNHAGISVAQVLYSSRFYNKVLTQDEVTKNYTNEFTKLGLIVGGDPV